MLFFKTNFLCPVERLRLQTFIFTQSVFADDRMLWKAVDILWPLLLSGRILAWSLGEFHVQHSSDWWVPSDETLFHQILSQAFPGIWPLLFESTTVSCSAAGQYYKICFSQLWVKSAQNLREDGGKAIACIPMVILGRMGQSCFSASSQSRSQLCYPQIDTM